MAPKGRVIGGGGAPLFPPGFFVGAVGPVWGRGGFFGLAARAAIPITVIYGAETPARSRGEIEALAALPGIKTSLLPRGKLSVHEEFPDDVARAVKPFLSQ